MTYKSLFLSDIDGTLTDENFTIHSDVIYAAKAYAASGGILVLSTGRAPVATKPVARTLYITHPCIVYSGAGIYDFLQGKLIWSCSMDRDVLRSVEYVMQQYPQLSIQVFTDMGIYLLRSNKTLDRDAVKSERGERISEVSSVKGRILKILLTGDDTNILQDCQKEPMWKGTTYKFASRHFVEIVDERTDKSVAMKVLMEIYGMTTEQVFSAGDAMTDYTMLVNSGHSFVPAQASELLKKAGDTVIDIPKRGGMAAAFNMASEFNRKGEKLWEEQ